MSSMGKIVTIFLIMAITALISVAWHQYEGGMRAGISENSKRGVA